MKLFLPLLFIFFCLSLQSQTYEINGVLYQSGSFSDPPGYSETFVRSTSTRLESFTYHHQNPIFRVNFNEAWLTDLSPIFPEAFGSNTDNFNYQGENRILGENSVFFFDNLNFNIGQGNVMHINNWNDAFHGDLDYYVGQPKGSVIIFRHWNSHDGITTTDRAHPVSAAMVFANNAGYTYPAGIGPLSHVNGFVSEYNVEIDNVPRGHNGGFTFPVGSGTHAYPLRRQGVFNESAVTITVGWVTGNPNTTQDPTSNGEINYTSPAFLSNDIQSITTIGFWDWHVQLEHDPQLPNAPFYPYPLPDAQTITVTIPDFSGLPVSGSELRLVGYSPAVNRWLNLSGTVGATGSLLSGTIPANTIITALAVGSTTTALPVEFTAFSVKAIDCSALLEWQTGMEQNNAHFLIERSSDGMRFETIGTVSSKGNGNSLQSYSFRDGTPLNTSYYRVTQVDFDGKYQSTTVKMIRIVCNETQGIKTYPNPVINDLTINIGKAAKQVNIISLAGKTVLSHIPSLPGAGAFRMTLAGVPAGLYIMQVIYKDGSVDTQKILKQ